MWDRLQEERGMIGKVVAYYPERSYGFIQGDDGKKYFVSSGEVRMASRVPKKGCTAEFAPPYVREQSI